MFLHNPQSMACKNAITALILLTTSVLMQFCIMCKCRTLFKGLCFREEICYIYEYIFTYIYVICK